MTLQNKIEMVQTLKHLESIFVHFNDAKYVIALIYCRQQLEHEIRIENVVNTHTFEFGRVLNDAKEGK